MKTLQKNPAFMTVIINIQMMNEKITAAYGDAALHKK